MPNLLKIVDLISEKINKDYFEDIALAAYYGSYATGTFNEKSDIDIFFIPKTERGWKMGDCFIFQDIGIDIFPISWDRVESISDFDESICSVIADCKIFFSSSTPDLAKFKGFQKKIKYYMQIENKAFLLNKAVDKFQKIYKILYRMEKSVVLKDSAFMTYKHEFMIALFEVYAHLNQRYFKSGWGKNLNEIFNFKRLPAEFEKNINILLEGKDVSNVISCCKSLIEDTEEILKVDMEKSFIPKKAEEVFNGYYEEIKSTFNKIIVACDNNDYELAFFTATHLQTEITKLLVLQATSFWNPPVLDYNALDRFYSAQKFPDILSKLNRENLSELQVVVSELEQKFVSFLKNNGITFKSFESFESYQQYLELK